MNREVVNKSCTQLVETDSMQSRKQKMVAMADLFISLPGGVGTIDETIEIITLKQLGLHTKPILLMGMDNFWLPFNKLIRAVVKNGFSSGECLGMFEIINTIENLWERVDKINKHLSSE